MSLVSNAVTAYDHAAVSSDSCSLWPFSQAGAKRKERNGEQKEKKQKTAKKQKGAKAKSPEAERKATGAKYPDEEGALGPNGLSRKKGGNSSGSACKGHAEGSCRFTFCSFSHE